MTDYPMLFESLVLTAWGKTWRGEDPFKLGDAGTLSLVKDDLNDINAHNVRFALSTAIRKIAAENEGTPIYEMLISLDIKLWNATKVYNDLCQIMENTKIIFESIGIVIV